MAAMRGAARTVVFCTISKLARLVTITKPLLGSVPALSRAPMSLSRALCRPTSSRTGCTAPSTLAPAFVPAHAPPDELHAALEPRPGSSVDRAGRGVERLVRG